MTSDNSTPTLRIHIRVDRNPKKAGAAERFALYREGMTPKEYADAVGSAQQAYRDITWDVEQGYISLREGESHNDNTVAYLGGGARRFG